MSGFIARIAAVVFVLVFLYNRQSSARVWLPTPAPAVNRLPDDPDDPYYDSKSFFPSRTLWLCAVTLADLDPTAFSFPMALENKKILGASLVVSIKDSFLVYIGSLYNYLLII